MLYFFALATHQAVRQASILTNEIAVKFSPEEGEGSNSIPGQQYSSLEFQHAYSNHILSYSKVNLMSDNLSVWNHNTVDPV